MDQDRPFQILKNLFEKASIPHALLFTGLAGVGKRTTADAFAMICNCTAITATQGISATGSVPFASCGKCSSCRKIIAGNHPDILHIKPAGQYIKIAQIRGLIETLAMKPYEAQLRVVIIAEAQSLNPSAGNALLKMLEEPPDRTLLILTAPQKTDVLPTIVSRCQIVRFNPVPRESIAADLTETHNMLPENAKVLSAMADGSMNRAIELHRSGWLRYRDWLIDASGCEEIEKISTRPTGMLLAFAEKLFVRKTQVALALETMLTWLRDIIVCRHDPERVVNTDLIDKLRKVSQKMSEAVLLEKMEIILAAQKEIDANSNLRLTLEVMMLRLARTRPENIILEKNI